MLGNLSTDMSRQGIMTVPKGHCAACAKPIIGQVCYNMDIAQKIVMVFLFVIQPLLDI